MSSKKLEMSVNSQHSGFRLSSSCHIEHSPIVLRERQRNAFRPEVPVTLQVKRSVKDQHISPKPDLPHCRYTVKHSYVTSSTHDDHNSLLSLTADTTKSNASLLHLPILTSSCHEHSKESTGGQTGLTMEFHGISVDDKQSTPEPKRRRLNHEFVHSPNICCRTVSKLDLDEDDSFLSKNPEVTPLPSQGNLISTPQNCIGIAQVDAGDQNTNPNNVAALNKQWPMKPDVTDRSICHEMKQKILTLHLSLPNCTLESEPSLAATPVKHSAKKFMVSSSLHVAVILFYCASKKLSKFSNLRFRPPML